MKAKYVSEYDARSEQINGNDEGSLCGIVKESEITVHAIGSNIKSKLVYSKKNLTSLNKKSGPKKYKFQKIIWLN